MFSYGRIYLITNKTNNKKYIGQTTSTIEKRGKRHTGNCTKGNPRMAITHAIIKYGKDNFYIEELQVCYNQKELDNYEQLLIKEYNSLYPNGYNLSYGGCGNGKMLEETRQKISNKTKGRKFTKDHRKKLSESHKGQQISEKERQRRSNFMKGDLQQKQLAEARKKAIKSNIKTYYMIDPNNNKITITNMAQFCRDNNLSKHKMCEVNTGKRISYKGYKKTLYNQTIG